MADAEIDIEVAAHMGLFRNIDLLQKGVYAVRLKLAYGRPDRTIVPTGLFSAPSSVQSYVDEHAIPPSQFISGCEVDEHHHCCTSRAFLIRYRNEVHELNDGVFWRVTLPSVSVPLGRDKSFSVSDILFLCLELLHCDLSSDDADSSELYSRPDQYLPDKLAFSVKSVQYIALQDLCSGLHEYYSINFDADNYVAMDLMVHCCITAVHYHNIIFYPEVKGSLSKNYVSSKNRSRKNKDEYYNAVNSSGPLRKMRITTTVDTREDTTVVINNNATSLGFFGLRKFFSAPEKLLFGSDRGTSQTKIANKHRGKDRSNNSNREEQSSLHEVDSSFLKVSVNPIAMASAIRRRVSGVPVNSSNKSMTSPNCDNEYSQGNHSPNSSQDFGDEEKYIASVVQILHSGNIAATVSSEDDNDNIKTDDISRTIVIIPSREIISEVYDLYTGSIISNYCSAVEAIRGILEVVSHPVLIGKPVFELIHKDNSFRENDGFEKSDKPQFNPYKNHEHAMQLCSLVTRREEYISALVNTVKNYGEGSPASNASRNVSSSAISSRSGRSKIAINQSLNVILQQFIDTCQEELALQWSLYTATLRRNLFPLRHHLMSHFFREQCVFWKQQMISHTRDYEDAHVISSTKDSEMWQILADHISVEKEHEREKLLTAALVVPSGGNELHAKYERFVSRGHYARGLRIFDWKLLRLPSRLPYLLLEQYSLYSSSQTKPAIVEKEIRPSDDGPMLCEHDGDFYSSVKVRGSDFKKKQEIFHVIFLQHGFLGGPFDMRQLAHALQMLLIPTDTPDSLPESYVPMHQHEHDASHCSYCTSDRTRDHNHKTGAGQQSKAKHTVIIHCCSANEGTPSSHGGIRDMGLRMADEILAVLRDKALALLESVGEDNCSHSNHGHRGHHLHHNHRNTHNGLPDHRVSFIGHSLGGLIIRSALQEEKLQFLRPKLHTFMSLASPHVGNLYSDSSLVSTGMWALAKFKNYRCLQELILEDGPNDVTSPPSLQEGEAVLSQQSLLFRMSLPNVPMPTIVNSSSSGSSSASCTSVSTLRNALMDFKHVICVSSPKDQYVSTYSARIQLSPKVESEADKGSLLAKFVCHMIEHLTKEVLSAPQLVRVMVVNNEEDISTCAGNTAGLAGTSGKTVGSNGTGGSYGNGNNNATFVTDAVAAPTLMNSLLAQDLSHTTSSNSVGVTSPANSSTALTFIFGAVTDVNSAIGRSAHICYLDNAVVAHQLVFSCLQYFQ